MQLRPEVVLGVAVMLAIALVAIAERKKEIDGALFTPEQVERDRRAMLPPAYRVKIERSVWERLLRWYRAVEIRVGLRVKRMVM